MTPKKPVVGVVGAGVMGRGLAEALAVTGHDVLLVDHSVAALESAKREIQQNVRLHRLLRQTSPAESTSDVLRRMQFTTELSTLGEADFVIENVSERWAAKQEVYSAIDGICRPRCVFAANTSAIPITRIAASTNRAPRVLGMHFMNPVPLKDTVEVIRGQDTSPDTLEIAYALLRGMGKKFVLVNDSPGFVSNRVMMLMVNEAIFLLKDGVASADDVDAIFRSCMGHTMGPLETADLIGLDTILHTLEILDESFGGDKFRPCTLLREMVERGEYGRKTGRGFYTYERPAK